MDEERTIDQMTDDEILIGFASEQVPDKFMELLAEATRIDDDAQEQARMARRALNLLIKVGLERKDISKQRMVETTGIRRRDLYKRPERT